MLPYPLRPEHLVLIIGDDDADIRSIAVSVYHLPLYSLNFNARILSYFAFYGKLIHRKDTEYRAYAVESRPYFLTSDARIMRVSQFFISTQKEAPTEAELPSHKLMVRAGYIKKLSSGLYTWMPIGLRALRKVEAIVREEMNRSGAIELLMPAVQPAELWQETGRWEVFGPQMLKITDRHNNLFCFGPTHEEVDHGHRAPRDQELPPDAGQLLPDPDQVPRRSSSTFRRDARARVPDEGRLFLPCGFRQSGTDL